MLSAVGRIAARSSGKGVFYARKLAWLLGRTQFATSVGALTVPRSTVSPTIFYHLTTGDYEVPELQLLEQFLEPSDRVIELGAGIGFLANVYARRCPARHLAIEASPVMCDLIRTNTRALANLDVLNALAARPAGPDGAAKVPFYLYEDFWASSMQPLHLTDPSRRLVRTVDVPTVDLDALIREHNCSLLICDIEGGESALLKAFALDVPKILLELHWQALGIATAVQVLTTLEARGYTLHGSPEVVMAVRSR